MQRRRELAPRPQSAQPSRLGARPVVNRPPRLNEPDPIARVEGGPPNAIAVMLPQDLDLGIRKLIFIALRFACHRKDFIGDSSAAREVRASPFDGGVCSRHVRVMASSTYGTITSARCERGA
jgi:hypothetical protein